MNYRTIKVFLLLVCLSLIICSCARISSVEKSETDINDKKIRSVWVARFHYNSPEDVKKIIQNCADYEFTDVYFQVRGNGTVYYKSKIEPWEGKLSGGVKNIGEDPGWDPLKLAIDEAHKKGLKLHAYMNVFPGWRGSGPPPAGSKQLWHTHPDWFMCDKKGEKMMPYYMRKGKKVVWYSFINPANPEVKDYMTKIFVEVAKNYDIDGIHYDYLRYPHDLKGWDFSYDPVSLKRFKDKTGKTPDEAPREWTDFRTDCVTECVRQFYSAIKSVKPDILISAAVMASPTAKDKKHQATIDWINEGILDQAVLMNYSSDNVKYRENIHVFVKNCTGEKIVSGMGQWKFKKDESGVKKFKDMLKITQDESAAGVAFFSYSSMFPKHEPGIFAKSLIQP
jgi:uncharacterized lipoprotein YddW (UPF0748 family)